jgi:hypothetical protein
MVVFFFSTSWLFDNQSFGSQPVGNQQKTILRVFLSLSFFFSFSRPGLALAGTDKDSFFCAEWLLPENVR